MTSIFQTAPAGPPNIVNSLIRDHKEFNKLYDLFQKSTDLNEKTKIGNELIRGISIHDVIEERFLYPTVEKSGMKDAKGMADHGRKEHLETKQKLAQLENLSVGDSQYDILLGEVMKDLSHHMKEEENDILNNLEAAIGADKIRELGEQLDGARTTAPTHPHPSAPDKPPGLTIVGMMAAPIDKMKDMTKSFANSSEEVKKAM